MVTEITGVLSTLAAQKAVNLENLLSPPQALSPYH